MLSVYFWDFYWYNAVHRIIPGRQWPVREQIDLSGLWYFKADPGNAGDSAGWFRDETDKTFWPRVRVPVGFDNCGPGMDRYFGSAWFCRSIIVPESFRGRRIILHFEGINYNSIIWVNGKLIGENNDAFLPFDLLISDAVKIGEQNSITICVNNIRRRGQFPLFEGWYGQGGFLREASMVAMEETFISDIRMTATPVNAAQNQHGYLTVRATVNNDSGESQNLKMRIRISDNSGKELATFLSSEILLNSGHNGDLLAMGDVSGVHWWSPDLPSPL